MQSSATEIKTQYQLVCPQLPLAVYREVAAHLRQIEKVNTRLILCPLKDNQAKFDYGESQIQALSIEHPHNLGDRQKQQIAAVLDYYAQRYRPWLKKERSRTDQKLKS